MWTMKQNDCKNHQYNTNNKTNHHRAATMTTTTIKRARRMTMTAQQQHFDNSHNNHPTAQCKCNQARERTTIISNNRNLIRTARAKATRMRSFSVHNLLSISETGILLKLVLVCIIKSVGMCNGESVLIPVLAPDSYKLMLRAEMVHILSCQSTHIVYLATQTRPRATTIFFVDNVLSMSKTTILLKLVLVCIINRVGMWNGESVLITLLAPDSYKLMLRDEMVCILSCWSTDIVYLETRTGQEQQPFSLWMMCYPLAIEESYSSWYLSVYYSLWALKQRDCSDTCAGYWLLQIDAQGWDSTYSFLLIYPCSLFRLIKHEQWSFLQHYQCNAIKQQTTHQTLEQRLGTLFCLHTWAADLPPEEDASNYVLSSLYHSLWTNVTSVVLLWHLQKLLYPIFLTNYDTSWNFKLYFCPMAIHMVFLVNISRIKSCHITAS